MSTYEKKMNQGYEKIKNVEHYSNKRFTGRSYSHTHCREVKLLESFFSTIGSINTVLDIPCGAGRFQTFLAKHAKEITEMDYSAKMLDKAKENMGIHCSEMIRNTPFVKGSIFDIPFENNTFDLAFAIRIYHHFDKEEERIAILKELKRVSKKWIIITFFNSRSFLELRRSMKKKLYGKKSYRYSITINQFKEDLAHTNLQLVSLKSIFRFYSEQTLALIKKND